MFHTRQPLVLPTPEQALPGRASAMPVPEAHYVNQRPLLPPWPAGLQEVLFGMGCFWGAERLFWQQPGVWITSVGYAGGHTPNPTYDEVCSGLTGHTEVVRVVFAPREIDFERLLRLFWESHDPTQGMRQGNDIGTQYRSALFTASPEQEAVAQRVRDEYTAAFSAAGFGAITTEIGPAGPFYPAEAYHQQYLVKNPGGYCPIHATGVTCRA